MLVKIVSGIIGVVLLVVYMAPVVIRLKDVALSVVVLIGLTMMLVDVWQSLKSKDD